MMTSTTTSSTSSTIGGYGMTTANDGMGSSNNTGGLQMRTPQSQTPLHSLSNQQPGSMMPLDGSIHGQHQPPPQQSQHGLMMQMRQQMGSPPAGGAGFVGQNVSGPQAPLSMRNPVHYHPGPAPGISSVPAKQHAHPHAHPHAHLHPHMHHQPGAPPHPQMVQQSPPTSIGSMGASNSVMPSGVQSQPAQAGMPGHPHHHHHHHHHHPSQQQLPPTPQTQQHLLQQQQLQQLQQQQQLQSQNSMGHHHHHHHHHHPASSPLSQSSAQPPFLPQRLSGSGEGWALPHDDPPNVFGISPSPARSPSPSPAGNTESRISASTAILTAANDAMMNYDRANIHTRSSTSPSPSLSFPQQTMGSMPPTVSGFNIPNATNGNGGVMRHPHAHLVQQPPQPHSHSSPHPPSSHPSQPPIPAHNMNAMAISHLPQGNAPMMHGASAPGIRPPYKMIPAPSPSQPPQFNVPTPTTESIQKMLDENQFMILAILENQNLGKEKECSIYQAKLQHQLVYLATLAESIVKNNKSPWLAAQTAAAAAAGAVKLRGRPDPGGLALNGQIRQPIPPHLNESLLRQQQALQRARQQAQTSPNGHPGYPPGTEIGNSPSGGPMPYPNYSGPQQGQRDFYSQPLPGATQPRPHQFQPNFQMGGSMQPQSQMPQLPTAPSIPTGSPSPQPPTPPGASPKKSTKRTREKEKEKERSKSEKKKRRKDKETEKEKEREQERERERQALEKKEKAKERAKERAKAKKEDKEKEKEKKKKEKSGVRYWNAEEHQKFLQALNLYGAKDLKAIADFVGTRTVAQVRTHLAKHPPTAPPTVSSPASSVAGTPSLPLRPISPPPPLPVPEIHAPSLREGVPAGTSQASSGVSMSAIALPPPPLLNVSVESFSGLALEPLTTDALAEEFSPSSYFNTGSPGTGFYD